MFKFPSIEQFRSTIHHVKNHTRYAGKDADGNAVYDHSRPLPTLKFYGTVKLHGTNAGIVYDVATDTISYQSRERELSLTSDNAGFMLAMMKHEEVIRDVVDQAMIEIFLPDQIITKVAVFGEWCGGNIQKGVALTGLDKMFVVFAVKVVFADETTRWLPVGEFDIHYPEYHIYNIDTFPTYEIDIDFNFPEIAQNKMIEITEAVEAAYWRKSNHIHKWFVDNVQEGKDDCGNYYVSRDDLTNLKETCLKILEDHSLAAQLLPTQSGFFFGGTAYDDWYFADVKSTVDMIDRALSFDNKWSFEYRSSW